ncbi:GAF domain-containing SpoIIE family protein phosphatase [Actinacidiphila sp. DG2A-62]|uniref:PP2C family protein-serine/threonine phosphatase n=1 Tax=Actinacidiphila sp. DG2A-62 TaxID=3108821 RepID=UPI002DBC2206|nr:GAF domain-containing SpoIIE family protein phosphatase [Actinacidiphila sp. DG2A-62]MEC3994145.1 GAF domain-containing SpoIIE family protein phosphatase [Actinacidiphila sp. DG2A-62]
MDRLRSHPSARGQVLVSPAASPAADAIGSALDLALTGDHVVAALVPGFCDAASVYLLERWVADATTGGSHDPPQIEARRLALRLGHDAARRPADGGDPSGAPGAPDAPGPRAGSAADGVLPVGEVLVFPRHTPYARALATGRSQLLGAVDRHTSDRLAASAPAGDALIRELLRTTSFLVVPLRLQGAAIGFVACTRGPGLPAFDGADTAAVESLAARAAVALDNARRYEYERRTALAIRTSLLPATDAAYQGCHVAHGYRPAGAHDVIGGDWFDVLPRPDGRVGLIVGDAMGHGPEAAVAMIQLRTAARTLAGLDTDPAELLSRLDALAADTPGASFATCVYAEWDAARHTCTLVAAGHPPPLVRGPGQAARRAVVGAGLPLGLGAWHSEPAVLELHRPTLLLMYSDGLVESRDTDIDAGIERLAGALDAGAAALAPGARGNQGRLEALCERLLHEQPLDGAADDRTLLLAELIPA